MAKIRKWTEDETKAARHLVAINATDAECQEMVGRSRVCCRARIRYVDNEDVRIRMSSKGRNRVRKSKSKGLNHMAEGMKGVPDEVWADARRRACADRSVTSLVFGDPAPGQSAWDRRGASA